MHCVVLFAVLPVWVTHIGEKKQKMLNFNP